MHHNPQPNLMHSVVQRHTTLPQTTMLHGRLYWPSMFRYIGNTVLCEILEGTDLMVWHRQAGVEVREPQTLGFEAPTKRVAEYCMKIARLLQLMPAMHSMCVHFR
ncbi:hypothetical protein CBL_10352 [Carabus blaptoides fortunei]